MTAKEAASAAKAAGRGKRGRARPGGRALTRARARRAREPAGGPPRVAGGMPGWLRSGAGERVGSEGRARGREAAVARCAARRRPPIPDAAGTGPGPPAGREALVQSKPRWRTWARGSIASQAWKFCAGGTPDRAPASPLGAGEEASPPDTAAQRELLSVEQACRAGLRGRAGPAGPAGAPRGRRRADATDMSVGSCKDHSVGTRRRPGRQTRLEHHLGSGKPV